MQHLLALAVRIKLFSEIADVLLQQFVRIRKRECVKASLGVISRTIFPACRLQQEATLGVLGSKGFQE